MVEKSHRRGLTLKEEYGDEKAKEIKEKMSKSAKKAYIEGRKPQLLLGRKGHPFSEELKRKISERMRNKNPMDNFESRQKISVTRIQRGVAKGEKNPMYGKTHSEEVKRKQRELRAKQIFPLKNSLPEIKIQNFLKQLGISFLTHKNIPEIEHSYQCDIFIPSLNLVIECDGNYWHKYPLLREIDKIRTGELLSQGFKVLRFWENEIETMDINNFKEKLNV